MSSDHSVPLEVDVQHVNSLLEQGQNFLLLDCREQDEFEFARIEGATLLPMSEIQDRAEELDAHAEQHVIVYCHHGGRSLRVTHWLRNRGFQRVQNMAGGIDAWSEQIDPGIPRY